MNLYLVPASKENVQKTIEQSVDITVAEKFLSSYDMEELRNRLAGVTRFNCWAMTESSRRLFEDMSEGDIVLLTVKDTGLFQFLGAVVYMAESEAMGDFLWTYTPGKPWSLIYFFKDIEEINVNKKVLVTKLGYKPNYIVPGIISVRQEIVDAVLRKYGSINEFLKSVERKTDDSIVREPGPVIKRPPPEPLIYAQPEYLKSLLESISRLRKDPAHQERAHESLVEQFYELQGFQRFAEIKHRQGRVDIGIDYAGNPLIVNEVKRDWSLTRSQKQAIRQGYMYANENGARYVVLTNGDYYALFDRQQGLNYDANFMCEFTLSRLKESDLDSVKIMKKQVLVNR